MDRHRFVDDEAAHSGSEKGDENNDAGDNEYDLQDPFIDDQAVVVYKPPTFEEMERIFDDDPPAPVVVDVPADQVSTVPPPPPPAAKPAAPNAEGGTPTPPSKPAAKKSEWIRPKSRKNKRMCQILQSSLLPAQQAGYLTQSLVTVEPDPKRSLEECWQHVVEEREQLLTLARSLRGLFGFFIAVEVHGGSRPKAAKDPKDHMLEKIAGAIGAQKRKNPDAEDANMEAELRGEEVQEGEYDQSKEPTSRDKMAGKPHFHLLLYWPTISTAVINFSFFKDQVMKIMKKSDVNERFLPENIKNKDPHFVRTAAYVMKGVGCPALAKYWKEFVHPSDAPVLPAFYDGPLFGYDEARNIATSEESRRFLDLLRHLRDDGPWCVTPLSFDSAYAPAAFSKPIKLSKAEAAAKKLAMIMNEQGIWVSTRGYDSFYRLEKRSEYEVRATYVRAYDLDTLVTYLSTVPAAFALLVNFGDRLARWFRYSDFQHLPAQAYDWVELQDAYYHIRTGDYVMKPNKCPSICFRSYPYTSQHLKTRLPLEWLQLVEHVCQEQLRTILPHENGQRVEHYSEGIDKNRLLIFMAQLLRPRAPKQRILFLWGKSNCGKSTLISFIPQLYPKEAIGFLNRSCVALSGINEHIAIIYGDEFDCSSIPRADLLTLTDGSQHLTVRTMHQDARLIENPLCPMVFTNNHAPKYKDDDSGALQNRFWMVHCENELVDNKSKQARIFKEHLFIVAYLNRLLNVVEREAEEAALIEEAENLRLLATSY